MTRNLLIYCLSFKSTDFFDLIDLLLSLWPSHLTAYQTLVHGLLVISALLFEQFGEMEA